MWQTCEKARKDGAFRAFRFFRRASYSSLMIPRMFSIWMNMVMKLP